MIDIQKIYTFFSHLSKREKLVFYVALAAISLTMIDRLIVNPVVSKVNSLNQEISEEKTRIKRDLHILAQKERIIEDSKKYSRYSVKELSAEEITTSILKEVGNLANNTSVYLIDIKPTGIKEEPVFRKYYVNLSCEAQMEQIANFIYGIENSDNLLSVEKYSITQKSEDSSIARCNLIISRTAIP
ncbi:MAG: hypothetical protein KJ838_01805 [Candidatus Omnitrophica bacterium]|nr:hypothetical protein [Candidatus Omnitrophota bacterium]